jgi:hypothetical protein
MATLEEYASECLFLLSQTTPEVRESMIRIKHDQLYPAFLEKLIKTQEALLAAGKTFWVTQGLRTWDEQHALYLKGRRGIPGEGMVTKVDAGNSYHNYGIAADAAYDLDSKAGLQPSWDSQHMKKWADAAILQGLDAGFYWKNFFDGPHIQLKITAYGLDSKTLKRAYQNKGGGMEAVFGLLDNYSW